MAAPARALSTDWPVRSCSAPPAASTGSAFCWTIRRSGTASAGSVHARAAAQAQRQYPQRGGSALPGHVGQLEEDLSEVRCELLGVPEGSAGERGNASPLGRLDGIACRGRLSGWACRSRVCRTARWEARPAFCDETLRTPCVIAARPNTTRSVCQGLLRGYGWPTQVEQFPPPTAKEERGPSRIRTGDGGFAIHCLTAWLRGRLGLRES